MKSHKNAPLIRGFLLPDLSFNSFEVLYIPQQQGTM